MDWEEWNFAYFAKATGPDWWGDGGVPVTAVGPLVAAGRTSDVYEFGSGAVVKVPRPSVPAHWAAMEARFTSAVHDIGAPAPAVRGMVQVDGRDGIVFERVHGLSMWELMLESPRDAPGLARELASVHKCILSVGLPHEVAGLVERMSGKIAEVKQLTRAEQGEAQQALGLLPRGAALLHGDLHPGNVLMAAGGPIVIDWFDAAIGHPMVDVVRSSLLLRSFGVADERPHLPGAPSGLLHDLHTAYLEDMSDVLSASEDELRQLEAVVAASRLAEDAEADESSLLALWRGRHGRWQSPLLEALSTSGVDRDQLT